MALKSVLRVLVCVAPTVVVLSWLTSYHAVLTAKGTKAIFPMAAPTPPMEHYQPPTDFERASTEESLGSHAIETTADFQQTTPEQAETDAASPSPTQHSFTEDLQEDAGDERINRTLGSDEVETTADFQQTTPELAETDAPSPSPTEQSNTDEVHEDVVEENNTIVCDEPGYLKPGTLPLTALASYPGSGNYWTRQLLARLSGVKSGDAACTRGTKARGDERELSCRYDDTVIAVKTHHSNLGPAEPVYGRAIVLIRHPLNTLLAEFNRVNGGKHTGYANRTQFFVQPGNVSTVWTSFLKRVKDWENFYKYWITNFTKPVYLLAYNNLKADLRRELSATAAFIGTNATSDVLQCATREEIGKYLRTKSAQFTDEELHTLFSVALAQSEKAVETVKQSIRTRWSDQPDYYKSVNIDLVY